MVEMVFAEGRPIAGARVFVHLPARPAFAVCDLLAELGLGGERREVEEVGINAHFRAFREEGRNERRLMMHVALWRG